MKQPSALFVTTVPITLEAFLLPFACHFREAGWRVDAAANGASRVECIADSFDAVFDVPWSRNPLDPRNLFGSARTIRQIVARGQYDIVHVHTPVAAFATRFALRQVSPQPSIIYTTHGFHFYDGQAALPHALYRTLERLAAPWTDWLVTVNEEDERAARRLGGIDPTRVRRIPGIGVDLERFAEGAVSAEEVAAVRRGLDVPADAFMAVMVAEFTANKRHAHLLHALAEVDPRAAVTLVLVGDGPLLERTRLLAARLGVADRVRFAGYRRDIPALLAAADALVLVSEREGLNRSVLEAMAAGRPVIGTDTRGIADAIGSTAGWVVPKNDMSALARTIEEVAADPTERALRGAAARERVAREFALPAIIAKYEDLYREALASHV